MKISVEASGESYYEREPNEEDSWDIGSQALTDIGAYAYVDEQFGEEVEPAADGSVCVLVEHYSDGCTFGDSEYVDAKGAFTDEDAAAAHAQTLDTNHGYFGSHIGWLYFTVLPRSKRWA